MAVADELQTLHNLQVAGALSMGEYEEAKRQVLARLADRSHPPAQAAVAPAPSAESSDKAAPVAAQQAPAPTPPLPNQPAEAPAVVGAVLDGGAQQARVPSIFSADASERHAAWTPNAVKKLKWLCWSVGIGLLLVAAIAVAVAATGSGEDSPSYLDGYNTGVRAANDPGTFGSDAETACNNIYGVVALDPAPGLDVEAGLRGCVAGFAEASR